MINSRSGTVNLLTYKSLKGFMFVLNVTEDDSEYLTLNGTTTINDTLVINAQNVTFPAGLSATTTKAGVGEIASISEIQNTALVTTDNGLNASGSNFVTVAGLKYWAS